MHRLTKALWVLRSILMRPVLGGVKFPSYIGKPTLIFRSKQLFLGRSVRIFPGLRAEAHGEGRILIADNVSIGQNFHITAMGDLHIGSGTVISGFAMVTDIDHEYQDIAVPVLDQPYIYSRTEIGDNCFIGMGARIQAGTTLGEGCIVGSNAVVRGAFPPHSVIVGIPGRVVKRYDPDTETWVRC